MFKTKPAPGSNREAGYREALESRHRSPYPPILPACNFRHIGDAASKIIERLASLRCEVRE